VPCHSGYAKGYAYEIVTVYRRRGNRQGKTDSDWLKKRYTVGRARDAHEAATILYRLRAEAKAAHSYGFAHFAIDCRAAKGKLAPLISYEELVLRSQKGV
jgi:hypothetical protein